MNYPLYLFLITTLFILSSISASNDEDDYNVPSDCESRRKSMERTLKKVTIVMNPKLRLYQNEGELYNDHCV